jgi:hypothetical protein
MKKTVVALTIIFIFLFASIAAAGGYMVYESSLKKETKVDSSENSDLKLNVSKESVSFEITNAIPGLIIFCFGATGLILMIFKIPVHEVLGYRTKGGGSGGGLGFMLKEKILSEQTIQAPLPVWWLLKNTEKLEKVEPSA